MITGLQMIILCGILVGVGITLLLLWFKPAHLHLGTALETISQTAHDVSDADASSALSPVEKLGNWGIRHLPPTLWGGVPTSDLAVMRMSTSQFYGKKLIAALIGLSFPLLASILLFIVNIKIGFYIPAFVGLVCGFLGFVLSGNEVKDRAKSERVTIARVITSYIDFVAMERRAGSATRQAMENAAEVGDSWVFDRLAQELRDSRWAGRQPWEALRALGAEWDVPELAMVADSMQLSGQEGSPVYEKLRASAEGIRSAIINKDLNKANEATERMTIPMTLLTMVFLGILVVPAMLRFLGGGY